MGKTKYRQSWESDFPWLRQVANDVFSAYCDVCLTSFKIDNQGISQVRSHAKCHENNSKKKSALQSFFKQRTFAVNSDGDPKLTNKNTCLLSSEETIRRAELLDALHVVRSNHSFASVNGNAERYKLMFGDTNPVASGYQMCETKVMYIIKFGIAPYVRRKLCKDVADTPFSFLFDETTTSQVKKQYDGYVVYWSKKENRVVHSYCGSLFVGHCDANNLVDHYFDFVEALGLDSSMLLHYGMDGPNTNLSFEKKMVQRLEERGDKFLQIGTCSLHPVHSAFSKAVTKFFQCSFKDISSSEKDKIGSFNLDDFFQDLHFFFKRSSARREDYKSLECVTGVTGEYMKRHAETRWVGMKYVALRVLEQWQNITNYFLEFLPRQKNFKREVEKTQRYNRVKAALKEPLMEAYVSFVAFLAHDFEEFLIPFQTVEPMIHLLYPALCRLMNALQMKFVKSSKLSTDLAKNVYINVGDEKKLKPLSKIDVGTKAKTLISNNSVIKDDDTEKFRKNCLNFYVTAVQYLQSNLPYDILLLQNAQYLHPEKRSALEATSAISNLALKIISVLNNNNALFKVFGVSGATSESVVDLIRGQWKFFLLEDIKKEWYEEEEMAVCSSSRQQDSYWSRAEEMCGIESSRQIKRKMKRIDDFWGRIDSLTDDTGAKKYPQLVAMIKCVLSLSHGNSTPERGFSLNKKILDIHGYSLYEETLTALRFVKDELHRVGGVAKFPITKELLDDIKSAFSRYEADRIARKVAKETEQRKKEEEKAAAAAREVENAELESLNNEISAAKSSIVVAGELIMQAESDLDEALGKKGQNVQRSAIEIAHSKLKLGNERKRKFEEDLSKLEKKKKKIVGSK